MTFTRKKAGALGIEAVTPLAAEKAFSSKEIVGFCTVYVFTFEEAYPVMVCFMGEEGNVIRAHASFVLDRDIITDLKENDLKLELIKN